MKYTVELADQFIKEHASSVDQTFRPVYHAASPFGWINDPNGFCLYRGEYHLFCQLNPYSSAWASMHWGHWTSPDLIRWNWRGVALAPDMPYDEYGCFSGHAICHDGQLCLLYTGVSADGNGNVRQQQCLARSEDGFTFKKYDGNPVVTNAMQPSSSNPADFRDPKVFVHGDGYRMLVASKGPMGGDFVFYDSDDLEHWVFAAKHIEGLGSMLECPDYFPLDGHTVTIASVMDMPSDGLRYSNNQPVVSMIDVEKGDYNCVSIDYGMDFYAPQSLLTPDGRRVMIGWLRSWEHDFPPRYLGHNWNNLMTIPRELRIENGVLLQAPLRELQTLRTNERRFNGAACEGTHARSGEWHLTAQPGSASLLRLRLAMSGDEALVIEYDVNRRVLRTDRSRAGYSAGKNGAPEAKPYCEALLPLSGDKLDLRIFLDQCSVEIFSADGTLAMSTLFFPRGSADAFSLTSDNGTADFALTLWDYNTKE